MDMGSLDLARMGTGVQAPHAPKGDIRAIDKAARDANVPARAMVKDEVLIDLARSPAKSIDKLPAALGRIFMMREWLEYETDEICKELSITSTNAFVMLYRARMKLRECLERNWFGPERSQ